MRVKTKLKKVLILEDEPDAGLLIAAILEGFHYIPTIVTSLAEVRLKLSDDASESFDLLFFDYNLPDGTSFEIINNKPLIANTPVILCSAYLSESRLKEAANNGVLECLHKPISGEAIKNTLVKHDLLSTTNL